jgi:hypothetical protein
MSKPIPQPPTIPFIGNVTSLEKEVPLRSFNLLAQKYGEIYRLDLVGLLYRICPILHPHKAFCVHRPTRRFCEQLRPVQRAFERDKIQEKYLEQPE